jgi:hypothetical protein
MDKAKRKNRCCPRWEEKLHRWGKSSESRVDEAKRWHHCLTPPAAAEDQEEEEKAESLELSMHEAKRWCRRLSPLAKQMIYIKVVLVFKYNLLSCHVKLC